MAVAVWVARCSWRVCVTSKFGVKYHTRTSHPTMSAPVVHVLHPDPLVTLLQFLNDVITFLHAGMLRLPLWAHIVLLFAFVFFLLDAMFNGPPRMVKRD